MMLTRSMARAAQGKPSSISSVSLRCVGGPGRAWCSGQTCPVRVEIKARSDAWNERWTSHSMLKAVQNVLRLTAEPLLCEVLRMHEAARPTGGQEGHLRPPCAEDRGEKLFKAALHAAAGQRGSGSAQRRCRAWHACTAKLVVSAPLHVRNRSPGGACVCACAQRVPCSAINTVAAATFSAKHLPCALLLC